MRIEQWSSSTAARRLHGRSPVSAFGLQEHLHPGLLILYTVRYTQNTGTGLSSRLCCVMCLAAVFGAAWFLSFPLFFRVSRVELSGRSLGVKTDRLFCHGAAPFHHGLFPLWKDNDDASNSQYV